jgi:subtilisin family serine protease
VDDDGNGFIDDIYGWDFAGLSEDDPDDQDADPMDMDYSGHGTHVAGIIAASGDNAMGVVGVNWRTKIMVLKIMAEDALAIDEWDAIQAVQYAIDNGARLVNCSFGGETHSLEERRAFEALRDADISAVCAAGNESRNTDQVMNYPSSYNLDNIISVAASNQNDLLADFSNYGSASVDVMAPGVNITSTIPFETEASVNIGSTPYTAFGMEFAGITDENGITRAAYDCGMGYADEFVPGVNGNIALIKRGNRDGNDFYFSEKIANAQDAGAVAAIIYNDVVGDFDNWTLGAPATWIPVICISKDDGESMIPPIATSHITVTVVNKISQRFSYGEIDGTSMATPYVTGVAGLLLSVNPGLDYSSLKSAILGTVDHVPSVSDKMVSGGRVNARSALFQAYEPGDVTGNNLLRLDDAIVSLQALSGLTLSIGASCISCGVDVDGDGVVGLTEAVYILQKLAILR